MSRNVKPRAKAQKKSSGGGMLVGIFIGLMLGAVVAVAAAWYFTQATPFKTDGKRPEGNPVPGSGSSAPIALPGRPGGKPVEKPEFDFYKILPQGENGAAPAPATDPGTGSAASNAPATRLFLQAGAFEDPSEADNVKARLALMGVEASVTRAEVAGKGTIHRVRVGPFDDAAQLDEARKEMASAGIETAPVKAQ